MAEFSSNRKDDEPKVARAEWDFSECPVQEVIECCFYEYARSSRAMRIDYLNKQKETPIEMHPNAFMHLHAGYGLCLSCPEFPTQPWLNIDKGKRPERIKQIPELAVYQPSFVRAHPKRPQGFNKETGEEVATFEISWGCTETQLVEDFKRWVKENHPRRQKEITGTDVIWPERLSRTARRYLNALAAWRLLLSMTWDEAAAFTEAANGKPLFDNQPRWITACHEAESFLGLKEDAEKIVNDTLFEKVMGPIVEKFIPLKTHF